MLIWYPVLNRAGDYESGVAALNAFVETDTGEIFNRVNLGDSEQGWYHRFFPTGKFWEFVNKIDSSGRRIFGSNGYIAETFVYNDEGDGTFHAASYGKLTPGGAWQLGDILGNTRQLNFLLSNGVTPEYDDRYGWLYPARYNNYGAVMSSYVGSIYTGSRDFIVKFLDGGGGVMALATAFAVPAFAGTLPSATAVSLAESAGVTAAELNALTLSTALDAPAIQTAVDAGLLAPEIGEAAIASLETAGVESLAELGVKSLPDILPELTTPPGSIPDIPAPDIFELTPIDAPTIPNPQDAADLLRNVPTPTNQTPPVDRLFNSTPPEIEINSVIKELQAPQISQQQIAQTAQRGVTAADALYKAGEMALAALANSAISNLVRGSTEKTPAQIGVRSAYPAQQQILTGQKQAGINGGNGSAGGLLALGVALIGLLNS